MAELLRWNRQAEIVREAEEAHRRRRARWGRLEPHLDLLVAGVLVACVVLAALSVALWGAM